MRIYSIFLIIIFAVYLIAFIYFLKKHNQSFRFVLYQAAISLCIMAVLNLTGFATGLHIPVNECTVLGISFGGVPFICGFLLLRFIFVL